MSFNERKTENIIRRLLEVNKEVFEKEIGKHVFIEEQKSDNPVVQKQLKTASKRGNGAGYPEFIVSFQNSNLVIVVECKADIRNHKSKTLDNFSNFAVDGALLYASYLSKEFDVIAMGVSGESKNELQIDTFLQIKGEKKARDLGIKKIYDFEDYFNILKKDTTKKDLDIRQLMEYSKILNKHLRDVFEFEENQRPLIVSAILLALEDESFRSSYQKKQKPLDIAYLLITTIKERLEHDNIGEMKKNTMIQTYSFIKTNTYIINDTNKDGTPNTYLKDLIKEVEDNVKPVLENHKYHDFLGLFYKEFLRYSNGDGGLGIVLTPSHITELFSDLAEVNKDSVIVDNCCGTGGFLISAMKRMEEEAKIDRRKINNIHKNQIIGVENNAKMFCLACSNMMLRGDGKSNIHQKDCFEIDKQEIKKFKPTIAFLNPPYSKGNGHKELVFIENALSFLEPNGICVAIVPQSCAMNTKRGNLAVKERLLQYHTLKAVMSMPDTLFSNSDKNAVTCIMVFEAWRPHTQNAKTYFGYWKDDGFIKVRPYGRIDYYGKYDKKIRKLWLDSFYNKSEIQGFSTLTHVDFADEWLVEAYIETNFSSLKDRDFEETLKGYSTFLYFNELQGKVSKESYSNKKLKLDFKSWKEVSLNRLFRVKGAKTTDKKILDEKHAGKKYSYVTTQSSNNGVRGFYDFHTDEGNVLVIDSAVIGCCSYQPLNFSASDHVEKLIPNFNINVYRGLFLTTVINKEQYRYSYGRKFNQIRIRDTIIKLPFKNGEVDWDFIENYIKGLNHSKYLEIK